MSGEMEPARIELEINGRAWQQVASLANSGPRDRHFTVEIGAGQAILRFGDGIHGARPPSHAQQIRLPYEATSGYTHIALQMGRAQPVGEREPEEQPGHLCGLYRAVVLDNLDPLGGMRLMIQCPEALGLQAAWALPCLPPGPVTLPVSGAHVWILFEHGDRNYPVWVGLMGG